MDLGAAMLGLTTVDSDPSETGVSGAIHVDEREAKLAAIAQYVFFLARKIQMTELGDDVIALSNLESLLLRHIDVHPGITPSRLASDLGLRSGNTATALRSLESKGLITKAVGEKDRRRSHFVLTDLARADIVRVRAAWARALEPIVPDDADLDAVLAVLDSIDSGLRS